MRFYTQLNQSLVKYSIFRIYFKKCLNWNVDVYYMRTLFQRIDSNLFILNKQNEKMRTSDLECKLFLF